MRFRWGDSENITLSQETSANLPAGTYAVSVDAYSDDKTGTATISVAGVSQTVRTNGAWANYKVVFTLASAQKVTVALSYTNTAADDQVAAFDNVKILALTGDPTGISLKNELGGTAANLSDFNVWYNDYTLEVEGTAGTEITVAADNILYTPEATGTVRFVKKDGIVYVFEGTSYKTAVHSSKADYTYARSLSGSDSSTGNILSNGSFETVGDVLTAGKAWKLGSPWEVANFSWGKDGSGIRVQANGDTKRLVWRGSGNNAYFSQPLSLKLYKGYKVYLQQVGGGNTTADFNIGIGNAAGDYSYLSTQMNLGNGKNGTYNAELGSNENIPTSGAYFTFRNTSSNTASSGSDPVTQLDWIGLVYSDDFPITGVSSASYIYGTAYAPATAKSSYLAAKAEAEATIADATYDNVTGIERTNLQTAIDADVEENDAAYNEATEDIQTKQSAFTTALTHYQALIDAQTAVPDLAYASAEKSAFKTAVATSAADADTKLAAMTTNIRAYYESHAAAENVATASDQTSRITDAEDPSNTNAWTKTNTTGNINLRTMSDQPYTDADGTNNHSYYDSNSWGSAFTSTISQDVSLPAGDYLLTVKARGNEVTSYKVIANYEETVNETNIPSTGSTGGVYGNGWNDYSVEFTLTANKTVRIGVYVESGSSSKWISFGDFRLVQLNASATMTVKAGQWGTFIAPFDVTIPDGVNAYKVTGVNANDYMVKEAVETTIPANTPVLLENTTENLVNTTFYGKNISEADSYTKGLLTGIYTAATIPAGSYVLQTPKSTEVQAFYPLASDLTGGTPNRCYLTLPVSAAKRNAIFFDKEEGTTGIEAPNATNGEDGVFYNLAGQRVNRSYKGIIIQNRKAKLNN